jgi:hypothetical protein
VIELIGMPSGRPLICDQVLPSSLETRTPDVAVPTQIVPGTSGDVWIAKTFSLNPLPNGSFSQPLSMS